MRRLFSMVLGVTMVAALMTGCGNNNAKDTTSNNAGNKNNATTNSTTNDAADTTDDTASAEPVTITLGIWPEDTLTDDIKMHEGFVKTMKEKDPNVTCTPAYYKYATDTFMPMVQAGNCPTVFETWFTEPQKLIQSKAIADITDELQARGWLDQMTPAIKALLSDSNGRVYGIPRDGYALGLYCNVEVFEEAGLVDEGGYPIYPKTWDELAETAKTIKDKTGAAGICILAKNNAGGWHFSNIAWAFGANLVTLNDDGTYTSHLDCDEAIKAMEYVKSLKWDYDVLTADPTNEDWGTGYTQLGTGGAAMYMGGADGIAQPTQTNGLAVDKLALVPMPAGPGGQYSLYGGTPYVFLPDATEAEINAALDYLEVMGKAPVVNDEVIAGLKADAQNRVDNGVPVIKPLSCWTNGEYGKEQEKVVEEFQNVDPKMFQDYFDTIEKEGNLRTEEPGDTQKMYEQYTNVLQAVLTDKNADIPALMKTANDNYQKILDDMNK